MKYPHTPYFSFSPASDREDVRRSGFFNIINFLAKPLIITEKMDGSNLQMTYDKVAARNSYSATHVSFDMAKAMHAEIKVNIPENLIIFGEWLYAKHSIYYDNLSSYFQIFAVYDELNAQWVSWETVEWYAKNLGVPTVPVVFKSDGMTSRKDIEDMVIKYGEKTIKAGGEGVVVRDAESFSFFDFEYSVAKYVRANHVKTNEHWSQQPLVRNRKVFIA